MVDTYIDNKQILFYNVDTTSGDSGAPVYTIARSKMGNNDEDYAKVVLAIHHGVDKNNIYNLGSLITNYHLQFYNSNPNINY
ncbi:MAG: hypothetical protein K2J25_07255 [Oscillospiraceae bacterium]|nr:hypothetical protein [Oscillospiraceae bacterium]